MENIDPRDEELLVDKGLFSWSLFKKSDFIFSAEKELKGRSSNLYSSQPTLNLGRLLKRKLSVESTGANL